MKRRDFIIKTAASTAFLSLGGISLSSFDSKKTKRITILHTNDTHSHIESFPMTDAKYPGQSGVARRATIIDKLRSENPNTLLLDAGDMFQGTPYFNFYGGELEFKMMNLLKYDAATIGNHEFDNGVDGLAKQAPIAQFDIINANYDFKNTLMDGFTKPYKVYVKDGIKIGVFGVGIKLEGLVNKREYGETIWHHPVEVAQDMSRILREEEKCDLVICLSHLGFRYKNEDLTSDLDLAASTKGIDLIIGGHTHTFLDQPVVVKNAEGKDVIVNQAGCYGLRMGQIDFFFEDSKIVSNAARSIKL